MLGSQRPYRACRVKGGHAATEVDRGIPTPARGGPTPAHAGRSPPHRAAAIVDQHFHSGPSISLILSLLSLSLADSMIRNSSRSTLAALSNKLPSSSRFQDYSSMLYILEVNP